MVVVFTCAYSFIFYQTRNFISILRKIHLDYEFIHSMNIKIQLSIFLIMGYSVIIVNKAYTLIFELLFYDVSAIIFHGQLHNNFLDIH